MNDLEKEDYNSPPAPSLPLFLFFACKMSGNNFMRHNILDVNVQCWPYIDEAPVFYSKINHCGKNSEAKGTRSEQSAERVLEELLSWVDSVTETASSSLGLKLHPVLFAHGGDLFHFLFLFRMLETYGVSAVDTLQAHNVHFADPFPVLKQYKDANHAWLIESRSLKVGSLLNDWFPAQFNPEDLLHSGGCSLLTMKLYTQCPLYWLLHKIPIYTSAEWIEFYKGERCYQDDKKELYDNLPSSITGIQRRFTVKHLLQCNYSWSQVIELYKSCGSPEHFRQELRDIDIKMAAAKKITYVVDAMELEQDGSREYKVRIKPTMQHSQYYHLTDARRRYFILRVANVLPPCCIGPSDLWVGKGQWKVPESLMRIGPPETWDAVNGLDANTDLDEKSKGLDATGAGRFDDFRDPTVQSDDDSSDKEWPTLTNQDGSEEEEGHAEGHLPSHYFKEPQPVHVPTTLRTGAQVANNFFSFQSQDGLYEEVSREEEPRVADCCLSNGITELTNQIASVRVQDIASTNQDVARSCSIATNDQSSAKSRDIGHSANQKNPSHSKEGEFGNRFPKRNFSTDFFNGNSLTFTKKPPHLQHSGSTN